MVQRQTDERNGDQQSRLYRLNTVLVSPPPDATIIAGHQVYHDHEHLNELKARLRPTHLVKRSRDGIDCISYAVDGEMFGERAEMKLANRPDVVQSLIREWLARSLARYGVTRARSDVLRYTSTRPESNLLIEVLPSGVRIPEGVGRRIAADFDVRRIRGKSGHARCVVCIDIKARITIDCPLTVLVAAGLNPHGLYVQREVETARGPHRRLAGRIRAIEGDSLLLEDHDDVPVLPMKAAWLEPRAENLERVVRTIVGSRSRQIMEDLHAKVANRLGGQARLELIDEWVEALRKFPVDNKVMRADGGRFPNFELYEKPALVFDVGLTKTEKSNRAGLDKFGPYNFERFPNRRPNIAIICQESRQGDVEKFVRQLLDGVPNSQWASKGLLRRYHLEKPLVWTFTCRSPAATDYREAVAAAIDAATSRNEKWHLAFVQTDEASHDLRGDDNPYLLTKAMFLQHQTPTQAFEWESIRPGTNIEATLNNIGLAAYAKLGGTPWLLPVHQTVAHELIVGLGSFESSESRIGGRQKYVGVSTVFSASGRYFLESRTPATPASEYVKALLDALTRAIEVIRASEGWSSDDRVRLIFHVFKDFNQSEIKAVKHLMAQLRLPNAEFAFIHLVQDHPFMLFDPSEEGVGLNRRKGVATAPRGLRVDLGNNEVLVCLRGASELRRWTDGIPKPLLLRLHHDSTFKDLSYLARQVFDFTCLSWRTLFTSSSPISIHYADLVASLLIRLREVSIWSPEAILGPVGRTRWFL